MFGKRTEKPEPEEEEETYFSLRKKETALRTQEATVILDLIERRTQVMREFLQRHFDPDRKTWCDRPWPLKVMADEIADLAHSLRKMVFYEMTD